MYTSKMTVSGNRVFQPQRFLNFSITAWFSSLICAQIVFVSYLVFGYGLTGATEGWSSWGQFNNTAYIENDLLGNLAYGLHVLLAIAMILGGSLQVLPSVRNRFRRFHQINGRIVVGLASVISLAGLYLIIFRGTVGSTVMHLLTSFGGVVILVSGVMSVQAARNKDFVLHKIWAIRLYLAANGVLFFRLMIFAWFAVFGTLGVNTKDFTGPTVICISIASYVLPLLIAEWVRYSSKQNRPLIVIPCACLLLIASATFLLGLVVITMGSWYPSVVA